jgi:N-acetylmuramic acid 6-phosphate (MurNAc-6-P) etherase
MVALLLACTAKPTAATDNVQEARYVAKAGETAVYRFCDSGRIVYVSDGYKSGGIAVSDVSCDLMDR